MEQLYDYCRIARQILQGEHGVGRVIARPFIGESGHYTRTPRRHDFSLLPPAVTMLDQLKAAFIRTLKLDDEHAITPENSHLFAAMGSAMNAKDEVTVSLTDMKDRLKNSIKMDFEVERMEPLFATEEDYKAFNERQSAYQVKKGDLSQ